MQLLENGDQDLGRHGGYGRVLQRTSYEGFVCPLCMCRMDISELVVVAVVPRIGERCRRWRVVLVERHGGSRQQASG